MHFRISPLDSNSDGRIGLALFLFPYERKRRAAVLRTPSSGFIPRKCKMVPNERTTKLGACAGQTLKNEFGELRSARIYATQSPERKRYLWDAYGLILDEDGNYPEWI